MWYGWLLFGSLLAIYVHVNHFESVRRWLYARKGLCVCGREPDACACPSEPRESGPLLYVKCECDHKDADGTGGCCDYKDGHCCCRK